MKSIQLLLWGSVLSFCLLMGFMGWEQKVAVAATIAPAGVNLPPGISTTSPPSLSLQSTITHFFETMPRGYYTITDAEQLKRQLDNPNTVLIDVREVSEYRLGHIPGALNIPLRSLTEHLDDISRHQSVILYCSTGYRSAMGVMTLHLLGYDNVQGFPPSFNGWKLAGEAIAPS